MMMYLRDIEENFPGEFHPCPHPVVRTTAIDARVSESNLETQFGLWVNREKHFLFSLHASVVFLLQISLIMCTYHVEDCFFMRIKPLPFAEGMDYFSPFPAQVVELVNATLVERRGGAVVGSCSWRILSSESGIRSYPVWSYTSGVTQFDFAKVLPAHSSVEVHQFPPEGDRKGSAVTRGPACMCMSCVSCKPIGGEESCSFGVPSHHPQKKCTSSPGTM